MFERSDCVPVAQSLDKRQCRTVAFVVVMLPDMPICNVPPVVAALDKLRALTARRPEFKTMVG